MTGQQRADISNGVWLCQTCAKKVDDDEVRFSAAVLYHWKVVAEQTALHEIGKTAPRRDAVQIVDKWVNTSYPETAGINLDLAGAQRTTRPSALTSKAGSRSCWTRQTEPRPD